MTEWNGGTAELRNTIQNIWNNLKHGIYGIF